MFGRKLTIVMYHSVNPTPDRYSVSPEQFQRQLDFIQEHYRVVALRDVPRYLDQGGERLVVLTFDDALADFIPFAQPALAARALPSTVFVPTGHIGGWNSWDRNRQNIQPKKIMTAEQLRFVAAGDGLVELGSHAVSHPSMGRLSSEAMTREARDSRRSLEDLLQRPVTMFAYPYGGYGDFTPQTEQVLRACGYTLAVTTRWGTRNTVRDLYRLCRISFASDASLSSIRARIEGWYDWKDIRDRARYRFGRRKSHSHQRPMHPRV